mmetsp:Transcript_6730/g.11810  ORF Transcript_6730/g.11810 Transcript_6730/m.11810 type:complete len:315 (+) Transcript_6730:1-945(+)
MEEPEVPSSLPAEGLLFRQPETSKSSLEAAFCTACGLHCGSSLQALLGSQPLSRLPPAPSQGGFVKPEPPRQHVVPSRTHQTVTKDLRHKTNRASSQPPQASFCGHWCGQECEMQLHQASMMLTRPNFIRPPARSGLCDPDLPIGLYRSEDDLDMCSPVKWARPPELPELPNDMDVDDSGGCNRQTTRPNFWQKVDDSDSSLEQQILQARISQEEHDASLAIQQPPDSPPRIAPGQPQPISISSTWKNADHSLNSILHKPGMRSPGDVRVTFTLDEKTTRPARPFLPLPKPQTASKGRGHVSDNGVLWHLLPGS